MAYGIKYQLLCKGKNKITSKCVISELDYVGSEINRNIPTNPFRLRKDFGGVISGTSFEFGMREAVDFEFLQFYTNNPKKYLVEFYYPSTTLIWSGYINPQQYSADYKPAPNTLFFQATDGLGLLKDEPFTLTGLNSELTILRHCLDKIGLGLSYAIAINMWEISHDRTKSVLAQTYQESVIFSGKNCYEVIESILGNGKYDATITQWNNKWRIVSYKDKKATRMLYSSAGVYDTTEAAPAVQELIGYTGSGDNTWPVGTLKMDLMSGGKKVKLTHDYGRKDSFLENYNFESFDSDTEKFADWTYSTGLNTHQYSYEDKKYCNIMPSLTLTDLYIEQSIAIENVSGEAFVFSFVTGMLENYIYNGQYAYTSRTVKLRCSVTNGSSTRYLTNTGWGSTPTDITKTVQSFHKPTLTTFEYITDEIPFSGTLTVRLYKSTYDPAAEPGIAGVLWGDIFVYFMKDEEPYIDKFEDTANFDLSSEPEALDDAEILSADAPVLPNNSLLYINITRLSTGVPTVNWNMDGNDTDFTLLNAFVKMLASRNIYPRQQLTGNIRGANLGFESLIKHVYNNNREFEIYECEWDVYENRWSVTLLEWFAWSDQHVTFDLGTILHSAANLTVALVTPASFSMEPEDAFNTTVHVDNTGESTGRQLIEWKIVDGSDEENVISSGTHVSGAIAASGHEDHVIALTAPSDEGTYYVKCRMATDTSWVSSAAITVVVEAVCTLNHIDTIADGDELTPMTLSFEAYNPGSEGTERVYWLMRDSAHYIVDSGYEDFVMGSASTATYYFSGIDYPEGGTDYDVQIGLDGYSYSLTSNHFEALFP